MSEITRKLATIERITELLPHPNADRLEIAKVRDWRVVVQKDAYHLGQFVVYFEIDSFIPRGESQYEFLAKSSLRRHPTLGDGYRIKTIKLRGEFSQGLILPMTEFPKEFVQDFIDGNWSYADGSEGWILPETDVTELLKVQKWEPPLAPCLAGISAGFFPSDLVPKTDQERIQNIHRRDREKYGNDTFEVTQKMDGSSCTFILDDGKLRVCSRNLELIETEDNSFWQMARELKLSDLLIYSDIRMAFQGELCGPGIQKNPHNLKKLEFFLFDVYLIGEKNYLASDQRVILVGIMNRLGIDIKHAPVLGEEVGIPSMEDLSGREIEGEGLVFKSKQNPHFSFKYISPKYLLKHED